MATTITLLIFAAPLNHHHLAVHCASYHWTPFGLGYHVECLLEGNDYTEEQMKAARKADAALAERHLATASAAMADPAFKLATENGSIGHRALTDISLQLQIRALAKNFAICAAHDLPEEHAIFEILQKPLILDPATIDLIAGTIAAQPGAAADTRVADFREFAKDYLGAAFVLALE